jgi:hypothetical protein
VSTFFNHDDQLTLAVSAASRLPLELKADCLG